MHQQLEFADHIRRKISSNIERTQKSELGQYMTPSRIARFMAEMFPISNLSSCRLLDAGAGIGALSCAFLDRWKEGGFGFQHVEITAYEIDKELRNHLEQNLSSYQQIYSHIVEGDFITQSVKGLTEKGRYTHVILNPPYKKISVHSEHRLALRKVGIETVNLYSAFVALSILQAVPQGQIVAILPRSFCNGPYYRSFRELILQKTAIRHIHLFESRNKAFQDDKVLQENIIIRLERNGKQGPVTISTSTDGSFQDVTSCEQTFDRIVSPEDSEQFIHIPITRNVISVERSSVINCSLEDLGIKISTGPVVDFRMKEHLRSMPEIGTVPLLYPLHFRNDSVTWPMLGGKKPNAIKRNAVTEKWLYPNGFYCIVKRFSSKEEKRRIIARVVTPGSFKNASSLGFENHLNLFHQNKQGLPREIAYGLYVFLNSTDVDKYFRCFNGHTQVNATDLRKLKYPNREILMALGNWALRQENLSQMAIDLKIKEFTV